jgi:hypothetical protein
MYATKIQSTESTALRRVVLAILSLVLALAFVPATTAQAAIPPTPGDPNYTIDVYNDGGTAAPIEDGQHVVINIDYGAPVVLDPTYAGHYLDNAAITIAGNDITSATYFRPTTVTASGNVLTIDIAGVIDPSTGLPAFTADYNGIVAIKGQLQGVTADGKPTVELVYTSVAPVGFTVTEDREGFADNAQITITSKAQVRGMFHIGIYTEDALGELVPVYTGAVDTSPIQCRTFTAHAHDFVNMTPSDLAKAVVSSVLADSNFDQSTYSISVDGTSTVQVSYVNASTVPLYIYFFDDSLTKRVGMSYLDISSSGGILPQQPTL